MLDYKSIINKRYALDMSYKELAEEFSTSKSGINNRSADYEQPDFAKVHQQISLLNKISFQSHQSHFSFDIETIQRASFLS